MNRDHEERPRGVVGNALDDVRSMLGVRQEHLACVGATPELLPRRSLPQSRRGGRPSQLPASTWTHGSRRRVGDASTTSSEAAQRDQHGRSPAGSPRERAALERRGLSLHVGVGAVPGDSHEPLREQHDLSRRPRELLQHSGIRTRSYSSSRTSRRGTSSPFTMASSQRRSSGWRDRS